MARRIPDDLLARPSLTMAVIEQLMEIRSKAKHLQTRINNLPKREQAMKDELDYLRMEEEGILKGHPVR